MTDWQAIRLRSRSRRGAEIRTDGMRERRGQQAQRRDQHVIITGRRPDRALDRSLNDIFLLETFRGFAAVRAIG